MRTFFTAFSFLTVLPAPRRFGIPPADRIGETLIFYPPVGLLLGGALSLIAWPLFAALPTASASVLLVIVWALLTGGLHLDGVSDSCDAIFSSRSRERALAIMKDSHIGVMGAVGLFGVLGGKAALIADLPQRFDALLAACMLGRWAMVFGATTSWYARAEGGIASGIIQLAPGRLMMASLLMFPAFIVWPTARFGAAWIAVALFTLAARATFNRKLGGLTGDCLGAIGEASELVALGVYALETSCVA